MADILKPKRGKHSTIEALNPILKEGEIVFEKTDDGTTANGLIKMGDGHTPYNDLPSFIAAVTDYIPISEKGAANGIAPLNDEGLVPTEHLPSYVDDVLEYPTFDDFPEVGESNKLYVDMSASSNNVYRWSGTQYIRVATSVTYTLEKDGSTINLNCSDGTHTSVSNVGGVEIREDDPSVDELYAGKMWIVSSL